ncbi:MULTISPECIES: hypothetical protein [Roseobacteraceae]|uniref:Uncharacterized protein n=2 Tax=Roseobacteraceae TaxID=2854170 RepID=A0A239LC08_9RHOB|nr:MULTISPECIES: hypothetical protein [Roseobacteraceae]SLN77366.1 hypothetical protein ROA7023_04382 [Roseisalinus antarcticus]SNT27458.1 hypothetical protein SAMN04488078_10849 [Antarctobacter heliothermus]
MTYNAECWKRRLAVLVIVTSWLTGCAGVGFETGGVAACPPVVEYSREVQARAAVELLLLPDGSVVVAMMGDYAVLREQARACVSD